MHPLDSSSVDAARTRAIDLLRTGAQMPHPLEFVPIYKPKVWGGRRLERLGRKLPGDASTAIGESWELADLAQTSTSGAGGGAERSVVADGPLAGASLQAVWSRWGARLFPRSPLGEPRDFPLLVKLLDARENLSVQVHPSPTYVRAHSDAFLKSEAWYIVDAEPGAVIYKGVREGVQPAEFRRAVESNDVAALLRLLIEIPVRAGDCHYLPSGTCHALGAGILVAEVQNPSDTTFRVFDWGRRDRELHLEQALQCIHFGPCDAARYEPRSETQRGGARRTELVRCEQFAITRVQIEREHGGTLASRGAEIWMVLEGQGTLSGRDFGSRALRRGQTLLLPAGLGPTEVRAAAGSAWLEVTFPEPGG